MRSAYSHFFSFAISTGRKLHRFNDRYTGEQQKNTGESVPVDQSMVIW